MTERINVLGGDFRSYYAAAELTARGASVVLTGFDQLLLCDKRITRLPIDKRTDTDILLLPLPYRDAEGKLKLPHTRAELTLAQALDMHRPKKVFLGMCDAAAREELEKRGIEWSDILEDGGFALKNAHITAQAAILCACEKCDRAPEDAAVLVVGAGRIGKKLASLLSGFGGRVTLSARKQADFDWAAERGIECVETGGLDTEDYDLVINTVPHPVLGEREIRKMREGAAIVELSSFPHGVDFDACAKHGVRCYLELSLPGRYFPVTAGAAIAEVVLRQTGEGGGR